MLRDCTTIKSTQVGNHRRHEVASNYNATRNKKFVSWLLPHGLASIHTRLARL